MINPPCKKCGDRKMGCHAKCKRYLDYVKWRKEKSRKAWLENHYTTYSTGWGYTRSRKK